MKKSYVLLLVICLLMIACHKPVQAIETEPETGIGVGTLETKGKKWNLTKAVHFTIFDNAPYKAAGYTHYIHLSSDSVKLIAQNGSLIERGKGSRALLMVIGPSATSIPEGTFGQYSDHGSFKPGADVEFITDCNFDNVFSSIGETGLIQSVAKIQKIDETYVIEWQGEFVGSGGYTKASGTYKGTLVTIKTP